MSEHSKITDIGSLLRDVLKKRQWSRRLGLHAVFQFWNEVVGRDIASRAQPSVIRGTVLWVCVSDSVWMQQLHLQKTLLLERINKRLPGSETRITDIRFQIDANLGKKAKAVEKRRVPCHTASPEELARLEELISGVGDAEIRQVIKDVWLKFQALSKK